MHLMISSTISSGVTRVGLFFVSIQFFELDIGMHGTCSIACKVTTSIAALHAQI